MSLIFFAVLILIQGVISVGIGNNMLKYAPGEIIVKYKDSKILTTKSLDVSQPENKKKIIPNNDRLYTLKFDASENIEELVEEYSKLPEVEYAEPNYIYYTFIQPDDTLYSSQWGLTNIDAENSWNLTRGDETVVIGIIDTGVDWNHPDLAGNIWNNSDENCNESDDADSNGYNGDCRGYDFTDINTTDYTSSGYAIDSGEDYNTTDNNPMDYEGHGTHCSGIAGAVTNNSVGVAGVCWNCKIMPIRAGFKIQHPVNGWGGALEVDDIANAIYYAIENNATILSMSFGGTNSSVMEDAIRDAYNNGTILVAASGNDGDSDKNYPAAYNNVISIAAIDSDNTSASYSSYGSWVDLAAPGTSIWSTYYDDTYLSTQGTSMAAPMIAGSIGLIKTLFSGKNQTEIKNALNNTGSVVDFSGFLIPRINIYSAILSLDDIPPNVSLISPLDNQVNLTRNQTFSCNASDWQLSNITFYLWNSSGLVYNETKNISGTFNVTNFNVTNLDYISYTWNCLALDAEGNSNFTSNFTLTIGGITTNLISPVNNTYTNVNQTNLTCQSISEGNYELTNVSFYLWNSSGLIYNETKTITEFDNSTQFNYTFRDENNYSWNCLSYNNNTNLSWADKNYTVTYDTTSPSISLISPSNSSSYTASSQLISFSYNISDINIANCSLIINNTTNLTNSSITDLSANHDFSQTFAPGSYNWSINCSDSSGNIGNSNTRSFIINTPSPTPASSSSGGSSTPSYDTYSPTEEEISKGYSQKLKKNDKIKFTFFDEKAGAHTLSITQIGKDFVNISVYSNTIKLVLGIGQSVKLNLTSSDYYDLYIKLNSIIANKAEIVIQTIHEEIPKPKITGEVVGTLEEKESPENDKDLKSLDLKIKKLKTMIYTLIIIFIIIIIFLLFREKKILKTKEKSKGLKEIKKIFNKNMKPKK